MIKNRNNNGMKLEKNWKETSDSYLNELQKFLDKADNIKDEELKKDIVIQMLKCDQELTNLAEKKFQEYYEQGKKCQNE